MRLLTEEEKKLDSIQRDNNYYKRHPVQRLFNSTWMYFFYAVCFAFLSIMKALNAGMFSLSFIVYLLIDVVMLIIFVYRLRKDIKDKRYK